MNWSLQPSTVFAASPVVPVMVIKHLKDALPMAQALSAGGIKVFEITLRSAVALEAIKIISEAMPEALVGAGTVISPQQYDAALAAGAKFIISPGATLSLLKHAAQGEVPLMPGTSTPSEMMTALELGYDHLKFFPAEANGGAPALKAISAPLPQLTFCPTGGISPKNVANYMALDCVATVGGSWMIPNEAIAAGNWDEVTRLTQEAVQFVGGLRK
ncbi:bifunctional 4-hydroxy-2-oxoglutarate aldolase/2-dehydro-3-deoxy-phosphogluconate aldolase [Testudinibacter sp. TR-2022]|uniref:bifunctional 4-hydroxy-2-oxoglutarate aldolase/2-dehydro-3-deoxy-phosphogluconate aldolase n=1 Tax=Testudinibacter sp. TR-2022 TaxID=2585029 RepID=UPI00111A6E2F|nr:bifunctional 4-hydroxy-2-oxoglutarate aldolase/2-dehydro-3-deoxy-phosphogluconate aldolase [Testudinibacter sp. TR-2022]TNH09258.1 bifunctional 4-hydroxy-2-oxoglutarate aldolase/2-dehydro-3-deoxy-phosphogluconate aldolase [Pasteurellaceae bacterium Phil11]TNH25753.1 bifunctional 4-hydroxy-2-oxoglutarate aldolase/2-dehydro-3-deoxy-phosphogluconate aldolase [Testudinibacter sp. TR-2022]TNH28556.1 bifunctional 4-hydroxy-2-oxoglutarate aldolase/2-dehydro-3-deoxy-phosphogluconate aldolase [Testudi